ncbi:MAG: hypothetical protein HRU06_07665 [Oceanospirillaceae bacterium]|nr:hypothetical protein [Oceanospirillaceae bacterium]
MAPRQAQQGAVLIIALIFLVIMATLAASSMQATTTNERLAGNIRDRSAAFQAAEATLREAERRIPNIATAFTQKVGETISTIPGQYPAYLTIAGAQIESWRHVDDAQNPLWQDANAVIIYQTADSYLKTVLQTPPSYIIEEIQSLSDSIGGAPPVINTFYRITARAVGLSPNSEVVLQTTFKK